MTDSPPAVRKQRNQHSAPRRPLVKIPPPKHMPGDWITIPEIGDLAVPPVQYKTVEQWRWRHRHADIPFPEPDDVLGSFPVWRLARVLAWFKATGKPATDELWRSKKASGDYRRGRNA